jgi:hypothetical protein
MLLKAERQSGVVCPLCGIGSSYYLSFMLSLCVVQLVVNPRIHLCITLV